MTAPDDPVLSALDRLERARGDLARALDRALADRRRAVLDRDGAAALARRARAALAAAEARHRAEQRAALEACTAAERRARAAEADLVAAQAALARLQAERSAPTKEADAGGAAAGAAVRDAAGPGPVGGGTGGAGARPVPGDPSTATAARLGGAASPAPRPPAPAADADRQRAQALAALDRRLAEQAAALEAAQAEITRLKQDQAVRFRELAVLTRIAMRQPKPRPTEPTAAEAQLAAILSSTSWRVTAPLRRLGDWLKRLQGRRGPRHPG